MVLKVVLLGLHTTKWLKKIILATALMGLAWSAGMGLLTLAAQRNIAVTGLLFQMAYGSPCCSRSSSPANAPPAPRWSGSGWRSHP